MEMRDTRKAIVVVWWRNFQPWPASALALALVFQVSFQAAQSGSPTSQPSPASPARHGTAATGHHRARQSRHSQAGSQAGSLLNLECFRLFPGTWLLPGPGSHKEASARAHPGRRKMSFDDSDTSDTEGQDSDMDDPDYEGADGEGCCEVLGFLFAWVFACDAGRRMDNPPRIPHHRDVYLAQS